MAQAILCDGCGEPDVGGEFTRLGIMVPLDYCVDCARIVKGYLDERDQLHETIALKWEVGVKSLKDELIAKHPSMELPDDF